MSTTSERAKRQSIIDACLQMNKMGINQGTSGNISLRHRDGMLITPTGTPYEAMKPEHIVFMKIDGTVDARQRPSSEWRFHRDILKVRPEMNAVVHAHPPYATFGTEQLSKHAVAALQDRSACLLAHHGMIAIGPSLSRAMWLAVEVETLARQYHGCLQIGTPPLLPADEIEIVRARMAGYGPGDSRD